jgi:hypothetical protein
LGFVIYKKEERRAQRPIKVKGKERERQEIIGFG